MSVIAVAASGGRDSAALLHCTLRMAQPLGVQVIALHVHHGLQPEADAWCTQVRNQARRWGAGFDYRRLSSQPQPGDSIEAWARRERYAALAEMALAQGVSMVLLAHHRLDQAETWLLQALRGGGPAGLSAMPLMAQRHGLHWARPWLNQPRTAIDAYVLRHRLRVVHDASNVDARHARSRLRTQVWPVLLHAFPEAETTLAQSSRRAQEAAALATEIGQIDMAACTVDRSLQIPAWLALSTARRSNVLRCWLSVLGADAIPESLVQRLMAEVPNLRSARFPLPGGELALYRGVLRRVEPTVTQHKAPVSATIQLAIPGVSPLPGWQGDLVVQPCCEGGASATTLQHLRLASRQGSEQFQRSQRSFPRSLKKQWQAAAVPAWQRDGPLLYTADGKLLFVPSLGIDARCWAAPGEPQFSLHWQPSH